MSVMSTGQASAGGAVGAEFTVPGPWPAGPASCGTAGLAAGGCGCREAGAGNGGTGAGNGGSGLRITELQFRELQFRELRVREVRAGGRGGQPLRPRAPQVSAGALRPARVQSMPVRLTRRGRAVVAGLTVLAAAAAVALLWLAAAGGAQASSHGQSAGAGFQGMTRVVVRPGQTLWSIAASAEPSANPWVVIQQIVDANALGGTSVYAGELLWVPEG